MKVLFVNVLLRGQCDPFETMALRSLSGRYLARGSSNKISALMFEIRPDGWRTVEAVAALSDDW